MHAGYVCRVSMWRSFKSTFMQRTVVSMCTCVCRLRCRGAVLSASVRSSTGNLSFPLWSWIQPTYVILCFRFWTAVVQPSRVSLHNAAFELSACGCCHVSAAVYQGSLSPKLSSRTETVASRLSNLWNSVAESRTSFEAEPDTGQCRTVYGHICHVTDSCCCAWHFTVHPSMSNNM